MPAETYAETLRELRALTAAGNIPPGQPPVEPPRGSGDDPGMEARVKRLEDDVRAIRGDLTGIMGKLGGIEGRLGSVEGKLDLLVTQVVAKVPSGWQTFQILAATIGTLIGFLVVAAAVLKWLRLLPQ